MHGNSINLIEMIRGYLTGDVIAKMSSVTQESNDKTRLGITAAIPSLLAALASSSTTVDGARRINAAVDDADDGILDNLSGMFGKGITSDSGSGIIRSFLGVGGLSDLTDRVAHASALSGRSSSSILGLL